MKLPARLTDCSDSRTVLNTSPPRMAGRSMDCKDNWTVTKMYSRWIGCSDHLSCKPKEKKKRRTKRSITGFFTFLKQTSARLGTRGSLGLCKRSITHLLRTITAYFIVGIMDTYIDRCYIFIHVILIRISSNTPPK